MEFNFSDMPHDAQARLIRERIAELTRTDAKLRQMMDIFFASFGELHIPTTRIVRPRD